jgi:hypothetical protein
MLSRCARWWGLHRLFPARGQYNVQGVFRSHNLLELVFSYTVLAIVQLNTGERVMSKGQKSNKENKKEPAMTAKEKKAAKKAKKNERGRIGE